MTTSATPETDVLVAAFDLPTDTRMPIGQPLVEFAAIFVPSQSGTLSRVDLQVCENSPSGPPATVSVREAPSWWPGGGTLAQYTIPSRGLPGYRQPPFWAQIPVSGAQLNAGSSYAIVFTPLADVSDTTMFGNSTNDPPWPFYQSPIGSGNWSQYARGLFTFRVYVSG
jgi:hypothetical protein